MDKPKECDTACWYVYIVRCSDNSLYTGVTTDLARRLKEHNSLCAGARYTRSRRPIRLEYAEAAGNRSMACTREYHLKRLSHREKEILIASGLNSLSFSRANV